MSPVNAFLSFPSPFLSPLSPSVSLSRAFRLPALTPRVISRKTIFTLMCMCVRYLLCVERSCVGAWKVWGVSMHMCVFQFLHGGLLCEYINMQYVCCICPCTYTLYICSYVSMCVWIYNVPETGGGNPHGNLLSVSRRPGKHYFWSKSYKNNTYKLCLIQGPDHQKDAAHEVRSFWESEGHTEPTPPPQKRKN